MCVRLIFIINNLVVGQILVDIVVRLWGFCLVGGQPDEGLNFTIKGSSRMFIGIFCLSEVSYPYFYYYTLSQTSLNLIEVGEKMHPIHPFTYKLTSIQHLAK